MHNPRIIKYLQQLWPVLLLLATAFAVYCRVIGHDFLLVWDDNSYVTGNEAVHGITWAHIRMAFTRYYIGNYAPVQILSYMLDYEIWGVNAGGFLFTNVTIHALNGVLVYRLLCRWYDDHLLCLFSSLLFLLHPLQVESVAWISQRKNLLAMFFFLLAWEGYCRYRDAAKGEGRLAYFVSLAAFVLSLLAKSMTVVFPVVLVMYDHCFQSGDKQLWQRLRDKLPFVFAACIIAGIAVYSEQPEIGGGRTGYHGGSPWATLLTMMPVFCSYLGLIVWPSGLSAEYAPRIYHSFDGIVVMSAILLAVFVPVGMWLYKKDRRLAFWMLFFWVGLLPVSQVVPMLSMINDRYLYLPMMGVSALVGCGMLRFKESLGQQRFTFLYAVPVMLLSALAIVSYNRTSVWRNSITLFSDVTDKAPGSDRGWRLLADAYQIAGKTMDVRHTYERALVVNPDNQTALVGYGIFLTELDELDRGYSYLYRLVTAHPEHFVGWAALGDNLHKKGEYDEAEKAYLRALALQPNTRQFYVQLGNLAILQKHYMKAINYFDRIEAVWSDNPEVAYDFARVNSLAGNRENALLWMEKALQRGYSDYDSFYDNPDLANIWETPRFNYLLMTYFPEEAGK